MFLVTLFSSISSLTRKLRRRRLDTIAYDCKLTWSNRSSDLNSGVDEVCEDDHGHLQHVEESERDEGDLQICPISDRPRPFSNDQPLLQCHSIVLSFNSTCGVRTCASEDRMKAPNEAAATRKGDAELSASSRDRTNPGFCTNVSSL